MCVYTAKVGRMFEGEGLETGEVPEGLNMGGCSSGLSADVWNGAASPVCFSC